MMDARTLSSSSSVALGPFIDRSLIPDPVIVRCGRPLSLSLTIRANPTPSVSWYIGPRLVSTASASSQQDDEYQTTSVPAKQQPQQQQQPASASVTTAAAAAAAVVDADGDDPDRFLHRFSLRILRASRELNRGIFVVASNTSGDDCCFLSVRTYDVLEGRSKSYADLLRSNESKEGDRKLLKYYRKISFGSIEDQIRRTRMMEERNRVRSVADDLHSGTSSVDSSPGGGLSSKDSSGCGMEGKRSRLHQSPRTDFDTGVIFENVCLPSPLLAYRSTPFGRRKTLSGASPLTPCGSPGVDRPPKNTEQTTSQRRGLVSRGNGGTQHSLQDVSWSDGLEPVADIDRKCRRMMDDATSAGEHLVESSAARGATSSSGVVINHDGAVASSSIGRGRTTQADGSDEAGSGGGGGGSAGGSAGGSGVVVSTAIGCSDATAMQTNADANASAAAGDCTTYTDNANASGHLSRCRTTPPTESTNSQNPKRLLLVTDLDAFAADLPPAATAHATASFDVQSSYIRCSSSSSSNVGHQVSSSSSSPAAAEVLWELSGRKLSNICQTLITDCGRFGGKAEPPDDVSQVAPSTDTSATAASSSLDQTRRKHGHQIEHRFSDFPTGRSQPTSTRSNTSSIADDELASDGSMLRRSNDFIETKISTDLPPHHSPCFDADQQRHLDGGLDAAATEWSLGIPSIPASPLRFAPRGNYTSSTSSVSSSSTACVAPLTDALTRRLSEAFDRHRAGKLSLETAIDSDDENRGSEREVKSPDEVTAGIRRSEDKDSVASRSTGRRGRTMERGKYDATNLLKDFIKPEFKKFSLPPPQDLDLDTELAIWELSDFVVPDRHQSAPPPDATMQVAKSDDLLLRSRQTSVSPLRTRISGSGSGLCPRWIRGSKSVEMLTSRNAAPGGGARIRRRTLSKEWQIVTLTTREEITTTIRPYPIDHGLQTSTEDYFASSGLSRSGVTSLAAGQRSLNLRTTSGDGDRFSFGANRVRSTSSDIGVAGQNTESNDHSRVETEINGNPSPAHLDNVLKIAIEESDSGIRDETLLEAATNAEHQNNGNRVDTGGFEDGRVQTNDGMVHHVERFETVCEAQLETTDTAVSKSDPSKTGSGLGDERLAACSDELSSSAAGPVVLQQVVLDGSSSSTQNSDEVAFWTIITEALSEMMKEVQLAESANSEATAEDEATPQQTLNGPQGTANQEPEHDRDAAAATVLSESDSLRILEASDTENGYIPDNCETLEPVGVDIDALVQALLYFANEGAILESVTTAGTQPALGNGTQPPLNKSTPEVVTAMNESSLLLASSSHQDLVNEATNETGSKLNLTGGSDEEILQACFSGGGSFSRRTDAWKTHVGSEGERYENLAENALVSKLTESADLAAVIDDDFPVEYIDFLEIREESDEPDSSEQAELDSSLSASRTDDRLTSESNSHLDSLSKEHSASSADFVRQRTVSKQDGAPEVMSRRRRSDSGDVFAEKAFLESLFSSLGTIIFLLLAALIFHVFSRIVEHEL